MASQRNKTLGGLVLLGVLAGGYWLYSKGYIRVGKPENEAAVASGLNTKNMQTASQEHSAMGGAKPVKERKILYWVDPMHPAYTSKKPGTAPDCGMDLVPVYEGGEDGSSGGRDIPPGSIKIDPTKQQLIGVELGRVEFGPLSKTIRAVARLAYDETKITRIHTKISGWIDKVYVDYTGQLVKKGQPLFTVYSPDLVSTQEEFLIGLKAKQYLGDSQFKEVSSGAQSLYDAARRRLQLWDISDDQIRELEKTQKPMRDLTLYAPSDGFVTKRNAFPKQQVNPDMEVYELADLSTIWAVADVYEYELPEVKLGQAAKVTISYSSGESYVGKVSYIYPQVDNMTRTAKVRVDLPNRDFKLKPDMYANVELQINYGKQLFIPEEAILDSGTEQIVFVAHEGGYFEPRKVKLGAKLNSRFIVQSGLSAGETIVTSGNFLIDSESNLKAGLGGMAGMPGMSPSGKTPSESEQKAVTKPAKTPNQSMESMPGMDHPQQKIQGTSPKTQDQKPKKSTPSKMTPEMDHSKHQMQDLDHSQQQEKPPEQKKPAEDWQ